MNKKDKTKLILKYGVYGLILIFSVYFFILLFLPYGKIKKAAELAISNKTGLKVAIAEASYSFPFGISFGGIKISDNAGTKVYGSVQEAKIDVSPYVAAGLILGSVPVNINIYGVSLNALNSGFVNIPPLNLKFVEVALRTERDKKEPGAVDIAGSVNFKGGLTGSLDGIDAAFYPRSGAVKFNGGLLRLKPSAEAAKGISLILRTVFKKGGGGYYTYNLKNRTI